MDPAPSAGPLLPTVEPEEQSAIEYPEGEHGADDDTEEYFRHGAISTSHHLSTQLQDDVLIDDFESLIQE